MLTNLNTPDKPQKKCPDWFSIILLLISKQSLKNRTQQQQNDKKIKTFTLHIVLLSLFELKPLDSPENVSRKIWEQKK